LHEKRKRAAMARLVVHAARFAVGSGEAGRNGEMKGGGK
jgi:hypothetical protein